MSKLQKLEFKVRQKTVYFVTRYCVFGSETEQGGSSSIEGEFDNAMTAQRAAVALTKTDHARDGIPDDDPRIVWPEPLEYGDPEGPVESGDKTSVFSTVTPNGRVRTFICDKDGVSYTT